MTYQVLARKWRPKSFQDMVGQSHVLKALGNALDQDRLHHAYLFSGTRGVGKTTLARILAKCLNCETGVSSSPCGSCNTCKSIDEGRFVDLIEVDAASRARVEETRDLMENVQYAPTVGRYKVYLIDEIHMFSNHSFNALLKTLEEPPPHVKFLLATTEPKRLPVTILSRCLQFNLSHLTNDQIAQQLDMILNKESIEFDQASTQLIAQGAAGSMRDALSLLDQAIAYGGGKLEEQQVRAMLGTIDSADLNGLLEALISANPDEVLNRIEHIGMQNPDFDALLIEMLSLLQKIATIQLLPPESKNPLLQNKAWVDFAAQMPNELTQLYYQIALMGRKELYLSPDTKSGFEMTLIRMLAFRPLSDGEIPKQTVTVSSSGGQTSSHHESTQAAQIENKKIEQESEKKTMETKTSSDEDSDYDWKNIIDEMALAGLVRELAGNCVLKSHTQDKVILALSPNQEHLLNPNQKSRLEQAIRTRFGSGTSLIIEIEDSDNETPTETEARLQREKLKSAQQSINNDPTVKELIDAFDASVDQDAIRPI